MLDVLAGTDSSSVDAVLQLSAADRLRVGRTSSGSRASLDRATSLRRSGEGGAAAALALGGDSSGGGFGGGGVGPVGGLPRHARSQDAWQQPTSISAFALGRAGSATGAAVVAGNGGGVPSSLAHVSVGGGGESKGVVLPTTDGGPMSHLQELKSTAAPPPRASSGLGPPGGGGGGGSPTKGQHRLSFGGWKGGGKGDADADSRRSGSAAGESSFGAAAVGREVPTATQLDGSMLQGRFLSSQAWAEHKQLVDHHSAPAPGERQPKSDSVYARAFVFQLRAALGRRWVSYYRNTKFNFTRIAVLLAMNVIFGVIYYKVCCASVPCCVVRSRRLSL